MKRRTQTLVFALLLAAPALFAGDTFVVDKNHSEANFQVRHLMSKVSGKFSDVSGSIDVDRAKPSASSVQFTVKTDSVNTGAADRDKHLKTADFFDAEKCPEITFKSTAIAPTAKKDLYNVTGDLTMHCVTKRVTIPVEFLGFGKDPRGNERAGFTLNTRLNRKDYGINWNRALDAGSFLVSDDVDVNVNVEAVKKVEVPAAAPAPEKKPSK
jgi:polyisoprenoid-binding protein YceI